MFRNCLIFICVSLNRNHNNCSNLSDNKCHNRNSFWHHDTQVIVVILCHDALLITCGTLQFMFYQIDVKMENLFKCSAAIYVLVTFTTMIKYYMQNKFWFGCKWSLSTKLSRINSKIAEKTTLSFFATTATG